MNWRRLKAVTRSTRDSIEGLDSACVHDRRRRQTMHLGEKSHPDIEAIKGTARFATPAAR